MSATVAERVAAGAALLDEKVPGWDALISLPDLSIASQCRCVLGQLYGTYTHGCLTVWADYDQIDTQGHGFMWHYYVDADGLEDEPGDADALEAEWRRVIEARRSL